MLAQLSISHGLPETYRELIDNLDLKAKSELMMLLAKEIADSALRMGGRREEDVVHELAGSWKDDRTAEEMVADIYSSRMSNTRILENLAGLRI